MRASALLCVAIWMTGCGLDSLLFTPRGFDANPAPNAIIAGLAEPGSEVQVVDANDRVLASTTIESETFELQLPASAATYTNLRVYARHAGSVAKTLVVFAPSGELTGAGRLDAASTTLALLASHEVLVDAASSFAATPPSALAALVATFTSSATPELAQLASVVGRILEAARNGDVAPFDAYSARLAPEFVAASSLGPAIEPEYQAALSAAARRYGIVVRCDPNHMNALFTVDLSGRARDGNGSPQLIRQPPKESRVFLGLTFDETSPIVDDSVPKKLTPNDPAFSMKDDGTDGDERAGDQIYSVVVPLPRNARIIYKYTDGAAREGFTGSEEWPGNARILEVADVLTGRPDGAPDCLLVRRDSFGDEASNKNFVNLNSNAKKSGGTLAFEADLGGLELPAGPQGLALGGLRLDDLRSGTTLTPAGVPEARENGVCTKCPPPLVLDPDDHVAPQIMEAKRVSSVRIIVRFSEPVSSVDASDVARFEYVESGSRSVRVLAARPSGSEVSLELEPFQPRAPGRLFVRNLRDIAASANNLTAAEVEVDPDETPPRVIVARARGLRDVLREAPTDDPTRGEIVEVDFDEVPERSAAEDPTRYIIEGLSVMGAERLGDMPNTVRLRTGAQVRGRTYRLSIRGIRDDAGNSSDQETSFEAFWLQRVRFGAVPGFAFADESGSSRGIPRGERLYLTGTPLLFARDLQGHDLSIARLGGRRTDVTGYPDFELKPSDRTHEGQPIFSLDVLLPPGSWSYKPAHGIEGEFVSPPTTLEKVHKVLATTNDGTGVRVDPVTMRAANGEERMGAKLSLNGEDPPRRAMLFKREAPDEVCEVATRDVDCPFVVIGTWRDFSIEPGGGSRDYDDGVPGLPAFKPSLPDFAPPKLNSARARDSASILLAFDEAVAQPAATMSVELQRTDNGLFVPASVLDNAGLPQHHVIILAGQALENGVAYVVRYRGAADTSSPQHVDRSFRTATILAPDRATPFTPLIDNVPPAVSSVVASDLNVLEVEFDERVDPATLATTGFEVRRADGSGGLTVQSFELLPGLRRVRLITAQQDILRPYVLSVSGVSDVAEPANVAGRIEVPFTGFGEREPPTLRLAQPLSSNEITLVFSERMEPTSVSNLATYTVEGGSIVSARFSGDVSRRNLAFNSRSAPLIETIVRLQTSNLGAGRHSLTINGASDRSGNPASLGADINIGAPTKVTIALEYAVSDATLVAGAIPARALSQRHVQDAREGIFVLGARADEQGRPVSGRDGPVNEVLHGFPEEGAPLDGVEPQLVDDGSGLDLRAGDGVYTVSIPNVPLGTSLVWKAFAPFRTDFRDRNPGDSGAAFADAAPGPSAFGDGQEFPGNENGAIVVAGSDVVRIRCVFGDEVTYKKFSGGAPFVWVAESFQPSER